ncbi:hypothetical protein ACFPRL_01650 [Pseudoclavibacter helvolus]
MVPWVTWRTRQKTDVDGARGGGCLQASVGPFSRLRPLCYFCVSRATPGGPPGRDRGHQAFGVLDTSSFSPGDFSLAAELGKASEVSPS